MYHNTNLELPTLPALTVLPSYPFKSRWWQLPTAWRIYSNSFFRSNLSTGMIEKQRTEYGIVLPHRTGFFLGPESLTLTVQRENIGQTRVWFCTKMRVFRTIELYFHTPFPAVAAVRYRSQDKQGIAKYRLVSRLTGCTKLAKSQPLTLKTVPELYWTSTVELSMHTDK